MKNVINAADATHGAALDKRLPWTKPVINMHEIAVTEHNPGNRPLPQDGGDNTHGGGDCNS